ncbi:hypothetical protein JJB07_01570 [Tumebacillus sp. ITR2]|uniref:Uncharacterized protein n=1 Tax=Tumebacillus amylolyticus TaxID=2801339 RepID=A0ABS1J4W9_9BACL|nr:hypothetical protein [Tumebacillus amylolyticus]MBL0385322.1 hypothetical protein [Tumebacillus amylolyticus]
MGRSKRRKRDEREQRRRSEGEIGFDGVEVSLPSPFAPPPASAASDRFWRFAVAFLIIFVLLWLLAPDRE